MAIKRNSTKKPKPPPPSPDARFECDGVQEIALVDSAMKMLEEHKKMLVAAIKPALHEYYRDEANKLDLTDATADIPRSFKVVEGAVVSTAMLKAKSVGGIVLNDAATKLLAKFAIPMRERPAQWMLNDEHAANGKAFAMLRLLIDRHIAENPASDIPRDFLVMSESVKMPCANGMLRALRLKKPEDVAEALPVFASISIGDSDISDEALVPRYIQGLIEKLGLAKLLASVEEPEEVVAAKPARGRPATKPAPEPVASFKDNVVPIKSRTRKAPSPAPVPVKATGRHVAAK